MKQFIKNILRSAGYEINKVESQFGSVKRPVGNMETLIEDLKYRGLNCHTIMDVGANRTNWSRMVKNIFPEASFCLIEPQIEMKEYLENFCKEFNNSTFYLAGAGPKKDVLTFTIWDDLAGSSFLPKSDEALRKIGKQREVEIIKLDDLIDSKEIKMPELIKLDIQGFELEALKGAEKTFGNTEVFILEVSLHSIDGMDGQPIFSDVINFMLERNYVVYDFAGFIRRPLDGALSQCDICFVKKDGFLRKSSAWE